MISNLESNWRTEKAVVAQHTSPHSQFAHDIFSSQQGVMCLMSASGFHFLLNDLFLEPSLHAAPFVQKTLKMIVV